MRKSEERRDKTFGHREHNKGGRYGNEIGRKEEKKGRK